MEISPSSPPPGSMHDSLAVFTPVAVDGGGSLALALS